jgi:hypothetical protein
MTKEKFDLAGGFLAKQEHMLTGLGLTPTFTDHPGTKGNATEAHWVDVLGEFLPARYGVGPIFAIDSLGNQSDQIDVAIFDRQYSPLFFEQNGVRFVPAESVYAVFEVKPDLSKRQLQYAAEKIASVRSLHRTSTEITHAGGIYAPQDPSDKPILGGILATEWGWSEVESEAAQEAIKVSGLDLGIAVRRTAFDQQDELEMAPGDQQLIWFAMRLYRRLSKTGTVLAIDLDAYYSPQPSAVPPNQSIVPV